MKGFLGNDTWASGIKNWEKAEIIGDVGFQTMSINSILLITLENLNTVKYSKDQKVWAAKKYLEVKSI